ncbi:hypothetical protein KKF84_09990 [Myxococcota bacterium]|nr:hypothetical protein [Myxococcota bacterium]MBU1535641.1 hypothetical protein [Myxococcota bacterium]
MEKPNNTPLGPLSPSPLKSVIALSLCAITLSAGCKKKKGGERSRESNTRIKIEKLPKGATPAPHEAATRNACIALFQGSRSMMQGDSAGKFLQNLADKRATWFEISLHVGRVDPQKMRRLREFYGSHGEALDKARFGAMFRGKESVEVREKGGADSSKTTGVLYAITVEIPGLSEKAYRYLRCLKVKDHLYWVPFGW